MVDNPENCRQLSAVYGKFIVFKTLNNEMVSCHATMQEAQQAATKLKRNSTEQYTVMTRCQLRKKIQREFLRQQEEEKRNK